MWSECLRTPCAEQLQVLRALATRGRFQVTARSARSARSARNDDHLILGGRSAVGVLAGIECLSGQDFQRELNASYHWLVIGGADAVVAQWSLRLDTDLAVLTPQPNGTFQLRWTHPRGWDWDVRLTAPRSDLSGVVLSTVQYVNMNLTEDELRGLAGLAVDNTTTYLTRMANCIHIIFLQVAAKYNFTIRHVSMTDPGQLNGRPGDQFLYGEVGLLDRAEVDVCSTGLFMTPARAYSMDHTYPTWKLRFASVFLSADALGSSDALIKPFSWAVWTGMLAVTATVFTLHRLFGLFEGTESSWASSILSSLGTLTNQGISTSAEWVSFRILLLTFELFCLVVLSYYSASIVKYLLRPPTNSIHTLQDLIEAPYKGVADDWLPTQRAIQGSRDALVQQVLRSKISPPGGLGFVPQRDGRAALRTRSYAFYGDDNTLYHTVRRFSNAELCQLHELDLLPPGVVGVAMAKDLAVKEHLRVGMLQLLERGVSYREQNRWHDRRPPCLLGGGSDTSTPVGLRPMLPALALLLAGLAASAVACMLERFQGNTETRQTHTARG